MTLGCFEAMNDGDVNDNDEDGDYSDGDEIRDLKLRFFITPMVVENGRVVTTNEEEVNRRDVEMVVNRNLDERGRAKPTVPTSLDWYLAILSSLPR